MTDIIPANLQSSINDATGQLMPRSRPVYEHDARVLAGWMLENSVTPESFGRSDAIRYLVFLKEMKRYEDATVKRMISVACNIFVESVERGQRTTNPFEKLKGIPKADNETPHTALLNHQVAELLASIDRSTHIGTRDYALLSLLVRTGIRRSECASLNIGDLVMDQGHHVAIIRHGKGNKRRKAKVPVEVFRSIQNYIEDTKRTNESLNAPLFVGFDRWDRPTSARVTDKLIERTVTKYGKKIGFTDTNPLTPHDLRSTFITLALEGGAPLLKVQYAAGHDDPRTTERYQKRKLNLDDNAVDYVKIPEIMKVKVTDQQGRIHTGTVSREVEPS